MALVPLATELNLRERLGRPLSDVEAERAPSLLADASALVRNYTGREFTSRQLTSRLRVHNGRVKLPQTPVTAIASVTSINRDGTPGPAVAGWYWDGLVTVMMPSLGQIANGPEWPDYAGWGAWYRSVTVTYTAGYDVVPDIIEAVVSSIVLRALGMKPEEGSHASEAIDGYSYAVGAVGASGPLGMLPSEREVLDTTFRTQTGTTWVSS